MIFGFRAATTCHSYGVLTVVLNPCYKHFIPNGIIEKAAKVDDLCKKRKALGKKMSNIKIFESKKIRSAWNATDQKWYFSVADVVACL